MSILLQNNTVHLNGTEDLKYTYFFQFCIKIMLCAMLYFNLLIYHSSYALFTGAINTPVNKNEKIVQRIAKCFFCVCKANEASLIAAFYFTLYINTWVNICTLIIMSTYLCYMYFAQFKLLTFTIAGSC